jgi:hypothetical protein
VKARNHKIAVLNPKPHSKWKTPQIGLPRFPDTLFIPGWADIDSRRSLARARNEPVPKALFLILVPVVCLINVSQSGRGVPINAALAAVCVCG